MFVKRRVEDKCLETFIAIIQTIASVPWLIPMLGAL